MVPYSKLISGNERQMVTFALLQARLIEAMTAKINRGEFTERGLARIVGVSQPQMHNVLKGNRRLRPMLADRIMQRFDIDVLSLLSDQELRTRLVVGSNEAPVVGFRPHPTRRGPVREGRGKPTRESLTA